MANIEDDIINALTQDQDFMSLPEEEQNSLIDEVIQEKLGTIPKSESILKRASNVMFQPFGARSIPTNFDEVKDLGKMALRETILPGTDQVGGIIPGLISKATGKTFGPTSEELAPETEYGKRLNTAKNVYELGLGAKGLADLAVGGAKGIANLFKSGDVKKEIDQLGRVSKLLKKRQYRQASKEAFVQAKAVKENLSKRFEEANKIFGEGLKKLKSNMTRSDVADALIESADEIDDIRAQDDLIKLADRILEGPVRGDDVLTAPQVQAEFKRALSVSRDPRIKTIINQKILNRTDDTVEGLRDLKDAHKPIYDMAKRSKNVNKTNIRRVGTGQASPEEIKYLKESERGVGTNAIGKAEEIASKGRKSQSEISLKTKRAQNKLEKIIGRQKVAKGAVKGALTTGALAGLFGLGKYIRGGGVE